MKTEDGGSIISARRRRAEIIAHQSPGHKSKCKDARVNVIVVCVFVCLCHGVFVPGCHMMQRRDEWQVTQEIPVSIRKKKKRKKEKTAPLGPFHHYGKVCVCVCVCVCVTAPHGDRILPSTHGMTKKRHHLPQHNAGR